VVPICAAPLPQRSRIWTWLSTAVLALTLFAVFAPRGEAAIPTGGRSWELASIVDPATSSGLVGPLPMREEPDNFVYATIGPPPGSPSGSAFAYGISQRTPLGWTSTPFGDPYDTESEEIFTSIAPLMPTSVSEDGRSLLWASFVPLTPGAPPENQTALYRERNGSLELISQITNSTFLLGIPGFGGIATDGKRVVFESALHLLPGDAGRTEGRSIYTWDGPGSLQEVDVETGGALVSTCGAKVHKSNGMSASGNLVYFTVPASCNGTEKVYLRDVQKGTTTEISESHCTRGDCNAAANVSFVGATFDGKIAYMTTTQQLTNDDQDSNRDLYSYNAETEELTLLSGGAAATTGEVLNVVVAPAEVGGRVYFSASGELQPGESTSGEKLFLSNGNGAIHLVANTVIPEANEERQIQLSRDGSRALFVSPAQLLPGDTDIQNDAYLYDANEDKLTRISTGPSGGNGSFAASISAPSPLNQQEFESGNLRPYYSIDGDGQRMFFSTEEGLVPEDTDGKFDVYEYFDGNVGLITPGNLPLREDFAGVSRDGRTVLFATNASLLPSDQDGGARDIYAARLGGGFPEPTPAPECDRTTCPLPANPRVSRPAPASTATKGSKGGGRKVTKLSVVEVAAKAKKGAIAVTVTAPSAGLVTGSAWIKQKGKKVVLAKGSVKAARPGSTGLSLRLTAAARQLAGKAKKVHLVISSGKTSVSEVVKVKF
jgi:dipeptidyl aminopeptidase/acylaminoacyl peptidase